MQLPDTALPEDALASPSALDTAAGPGAVPDASEAVNRSAASSYGAAFGAAAAGMHDVPRGAPSLLGPSLLLWPLRHEAAYWTRYSAQRLIIGDCVCRICTLLFGALALFNAEGSASTVLIVSSWILLQLILMRLSPKWYMRLRLPLLVVSALLRTLAKQAGSRQSLHWSFRRGDTWSFSRIVLTAAGMHSWYILGMMMPSYLSVWLQAIEFAMYIPGVLQYSCNAGAFANPAGARFARLHQAVDLATSLLLGGRVGALSARLATEQERACASVLLLLLLLSLALPLTVAYMYERADKQRYIGKIAAAAAAPQAGGAGAGTAAGQPPARMAAAAHGGLVFLVASQLCCLLWVYMLLGHSSCCSCMV